MNEKPCLIRHISDQIYMIINMVIFNKSYNLFILEKVNERAKAEKNYIINDASKRSKRSRINYIVGTKIQNLRRNLEKVCLQKKRKNRTLQYNDESSKRSKQL